MLDQREREIMAKAASAIRRLEAENRSLREKLSDLEKTASSSEKLGRQMRAAELVLRSVRDGETDPEDALEKFAQVCDLSSEEVERELGKVVSNELGKVAESSFAAGDDNPLLAYLLGMR